MCSPDFVSLYPEMFCRNFISLPVFGNQVQASLRGVNSGGGLSATFIMGDLLIYQVKCSDWY